MRPAAALLLFALLASAAPAQPVRTAFDPATDGFLFDNRFRNQFTRDIETAGLCGGMVYAALDYFAEASRQRPVQWFRPAQGTPLRQYLYDRNVHQITSSLDRWVELGVNPGGARSEEFFSWGLEGSPSGQFERVKASIDAGRPIPLGLQGCGPDCCGPNGDQCSGNHVVLAIGYEEGAGPDDNRILVYDPNFPQQTLTLEPRRGVPGGPFYTYPEYEGRTNAEGVALDQRWLTYYADMNHTPRRPPEGPRETYPADGDVHGVVLSFTTGADDLRGGALSVTVRTWDGRAFTATDVNASNRWLGGSTEMVRLDFGEGVAPGRLAEVVVEAPMRGGIGGDNWNLDRLVVYALPGDHRDVVRVFASGEEGVPLHRFTGAAPTWRGVLQPRPADERTTLERGTDRPGADYRVFPVAADAYRQRCEAACRLDPTCLAWSYRRDSGMCHLKDAVPAPRSDADATSGIKLSQVQQDLARDRAATPPPSRAFSPTDPTTLERSTDRPGADYRSFVVESGAYRTGCQRVCQQDSRCQAWTFSLSSNRCWLKDGLPAKRSNADTISGIRMSLLREDLNR